MHRRVLPCSSFALLSLIACGAIFPRYRTPLRPPPPGMLESGGLTAPPPEIRRLTFVSAELPPSRADQRTWDDDGHPDLYCVLLRNGEEIYRTPVVRDTLRPEWPHASVTVRFDPRARLRFELRDDDGPVSELVSEIEFTGIPEGALAGGNVSLQLTRGATLFLRAEAPAPMVGMGLEYEIHEEHVRVLALEAVCPARTAGLRVGDRITAIDGRPVASLGEVGVRQAMDRSALRDVTLRVERDGQPPAEITVRVNAVYPAR